MIDALAIVIISYISLNYSGEISQQQEVKSQSLGKDQVDLFWNLSILSVVLNFTNSLIDYQFFNFIRKINTNQCKNSMHLFDILKLE